MDKIWQGMYEAAKAVPDPRTVSDYVTCGACCELLPGRRQNIGIMIDYNEGRIMTLGEHTPE